VDGRRVPLDPALARAAGPLMIDLRSDAPASPAAVARLGERLAAARPRGCVVRARRLEELDALPPGVDACWAADAACEAEARAVLTTAALSGMPVVSLPARWRTAEVLGAARAEGVRLAFADAPAGNPDPTITLA
jgi:hypothetical protein